ncbi:integrase core domain-containing protein [Roseovarius sp. S4756]|uniref:integrase core domain-containing protein n=1 Tax=Roseovarius maritimus TaxID=3342637 RepID=UPI00372CADFC
MPDHTFIERLWRSQKHGCVCLHAWNTGSQPKEGVGRWTISYNHQRPHTAHGGQPRAVVFFNQIESDQHGERIAEIFSESVQQIWSSPVFADLEAAGECRKAFSPMFKLSA